MKTIMYIMANDAKWMKKEMEMPFTPVPGMSIQGIADEHELKISGMCYVIGEENYLKLRLAWLTDTPLNSKTMINFGWELAV